MKKTEGSKEVKCIECEKKDRGSDQKRVKKGWMQEGTNEGERWTCPKCLKKKSCIII